MSKGYERIGTRTIYFNQTYYIAYAGGKRGLPEKDQKSYNKIIGLPVALQRKELKNLGFEKNPNVIPVSGKVLMEIIRDMDFQPFFDQYFEQSHLLQVNDLVVFESMKAKSYDKVLKG